jgi:NAD(P)-dependent dehydrogenase (short-subunit alcohol dehydrogenase family)
VKEEAYFKKREKDVPLKRLATPFEVSSSVEYLIKNRAITGQIIRVDSGESLL